MLEELSDELDDVLEDPLLPVPLGEAVDPVAARAWPTPTPLISVPAAIDTATAARLSCGAIVRYHLPSVRPGISEAAEAWDQRRIRVGSTVRNADARGAGPERVRPLSVLPRRARAI